MSKITVTMLPSAYVPLPPERKAAYDAFWDRMADLLWQSICEHQHVEVKRFPVMHGRERDYREIEVCADCGKELNPAMPSPVDIDQLADSEI